MRFLLLLSLLSCSAALAQVAGGNSTSEQAPDSEDDWTNRFWLSGQANFIRQQHGDFFAEYTGPNSFTPGKEHATSRVLTLYTGVAITKNLEFLFDLESAGGNGLSNALGLAGYTNVDVVRNPELGPKPYVARIMLHDVIPLSKEREEVTRNPLSLASSLPVRRLELRLGKMSTVDFFDLNSVGSDSHTQFMNWAAVNEAAYDYAADTRGYTYGFVAEYYDKWGAFRFGEMLMPTVANGLTLDWNLARARSENYEVELHPGSKKDSSTIVRLLGFVNHADMGLYSAAIQGFLSGKDPTPNIIESRKQGRVKYGVGLNAEQAITKDITAYGRLGWNDGHTESFAYTEADRAGSFGAMSMGTKWHRPQDKVGAAFYVNGLSKDHREYLALGGLGFILGDGALTYGLEKIFETYYTVHVFDGASFAVDWQHITDPGYNEVRGPVSVISFRVHVEEAFPFEKIAQALGH